MKTKKILITVLTVLLLIAFGVSAFQVIRYLVESSQQKAINQQLSEMVANAQTTAATTEAAETTAATTEPAETTEATTEPTGPTEPKMLPGYADVYALNNDMVGWIKIEGTTLDNPVMQTPSNRDYYLNRSFEKEHNAHGSIYAWAEADINAPSDNITLFGHNMKDGTMFAALADYTEKETWEKNPLIFFDTLYEYQTYKIFAVFATSANIGEGFTYHKFVDAENQEAFDKFVARCKKLAYYDTGITPVYGDKLLCLSTCEYSHDNGRLVVCAVRITHDK